MTTLFFITFFQMLKKQIKNNIFLIKKKSGCGDLGRGVYSQKYTYGNIWTWQIN